MEVAQPHPTTRFEQTTRRALVVDDLPYARKAVGEQLSRVGFDLYYAEDGFAALAVFGKVQLDLIVTDCQMPRLDGLGLLRRVREVSDVPVVMITAFASISDCEEAIRLGANRYLQFRRDLDGVGSVACELVGGSPSKGGLRKLAVMTAGRARSLAREELRGELERLLVECRGNVAEMARRMGRDRSTIRYHLRQLGMLGEAKPVRTSFSDLSDSSDGLSGRIGRV